MKGTFQNSKKSYTEFLEEFLHDFMCSLSVTLPRSDFTPNRYYRFLLSLIHIDSLIPLSRSYTASTSADSLFSAEKFISKMISNLFTIPRFPLP
jgi:hypothetical protein